jgi:hypothetical protein
MAGIVLVGFLNSQAVDRKLHCTGGSPRAQHPPHKRLSNHTITVSEQHNIMSYSSVHCRRFAIMSAFFVAAWNVHVGLNQLLPFYSTSKDVDDMPPAAQQQQRTAYTSMNDTPVPRKERARNDNNNRQQHRPIPNPNQAASTAPLFYHVSPGSTGSRSLYFAT